jgi:biopolymer transport protein ExbD
MLANHGILHTTSIQSVLATESYLKPRHGKWKRHLALDLLLTALIDAFSILVIFLLMSFSSTGDVLFLSKNQELPKSSQAEFLERNPIVKIDETRLFLEDKQVTPDSLIGALIDLRKQYAEIHPGEEYPGIVTIQADRRVKYEYLNQIVLAASHAGFSDIRFAVLMK